MQAISLLANASHSKQPPEWELQVAVVEKDWTGAAHYCEPVNGIRIELFAPALIRVFRAKEPTIVA
jgi:hypothetical protein